MARAYGADSAAQGRIDLIKAELAYWEGDYDGSAKLAHFTNRRADPAG